MTWTTRPRSRDRGIAFIREGNGPGILLVHGVGLRAEAWNAQISGLSDTFRVTAPDMPGHGESERIEGPADLNAYSTRLAALLDEPAVVIGHSMGAMIALDLAIRYPQKVRGVGALNAIYRRPAEAKEAVRQRAQGLDGISAPDPDSTLNRWFGLEASDARAACENWLRSADPAGYRTAYRVFAEEDGPKDADMKALACPALFMTGAREPNSTPGMSRAMAALVPDGAAEVIDGAAHMMPMTHPDQVTRALRDFAGRCQT